MIFNFLTTIFSNQFSEPIKVQKEDKMHFKPFSFKSYHHQRYQNGKEVMGLQNCVRTITILKDDCGCSGYRYIPSLNGFIIQVYNNDLDKPNMADKPMKLVSFDGEKAVFRGFELEAMTPFGFQQFDLSDYGFIVYYINNEIEKCELYMYDRNTYIQYKK